MHNVHPEIERFARYCHAQGIDVYELAQQYAQDNPLSYGDYLMIGFDCSDIVDRADDFGWDISDHPQIVLEIANAVSRYHDADEGINWFSLDDKIRHVFENSSPEIQALAEGGMLKGDDDEDEDDEQDSGLFTSTERVEIARQAQERESLDPVERLRRENEELRGRVEELEADLWKLED